MADIAELIVALRLQDGVSGGLGNLNRELRGMQGGLSQVGRGVGQVGRGLDRALTRGAVAAAAGLTAVITAAVSFEDAFAGVRKTVDATEVEFGTLEDQLREMARTMPTSFEELAAITEQGGALGIAFDGLDEFTKVVADLAATTDLEASSAATSLGVLGNVLGLQAEDFDNFGSALVDLGNKGASTESQILGMAERAGAAGALIGLSADQVLGFGSAAADMGIEVEAGGSALQRFFIDALTAVEGGGDSLEIFARTAGVSAETFRDSFREDAGPALADFIEGLGQLPEAAQIQTLADLGFNDIRITRLLLGLAGDADHLTQSLNIAAEAFAANSALGVEAGKRYGTAASQIQILKNNVVDAAVVIGEQLLPIVTDLTTELVAFINKPETQQGIKEFGENLAGGIRSFIEEIRKADLGPLMDTLRGAAGIAKAAFDAFRSLPAPIQQLALAAIVANKVTGGAVGSIAGGLANILSGTIKVGLAMRGSTPANPLWVQQVGGALGGAAGAGAAGAASSGIGKLVLGVSAAGIAALVVDALEEPTEDLAQAVHEGLQLPDLPGPDDWQWPLGSANPPSWLPDFLGGPGPDLSNPFGLTPEEGRAALAKFTGPAGSSGFGAGALTELVAKIKGLTTLPDTAMLTTRNEDIGVMLPDTAMAPVTTELVRNRMASEAKLAALASKSDIQVGALRSISFQLGTSNAKLAAIAAKNFSPTIKVENKTSNTVITNTQVQTRLMSGGYINSPGRY